MDNTVIKYRAFVTAAHLGSFTKAAEALDYSQSGISRMIADLERDWNVKLLERDRGGVRLTSEGHELLPAVQNICDEHGRLQARIDALSGLESGLIRIATVSSVATHWLPSIIARFRQDYPNIDYEIITAGYSAVERMIAEGEVDCGFVRLPVKHNMDTIYIEHDELKVVMALDHPMARESRFPVRALGDYPFMTVDKQGDSDIDGIVEEYGIKVQTHFTTWDDYAVFAMVEKGLGISVQPALILQRIPFYIAVKSFDEPQYRELGFAMRSREGASLATKRLIDYLGYRNSG